MLIALAVVLAVILLLILPVTVYIEYNGEVGVKVRYLFITFFPNKPKKAKRKKPKKRKKSEKSEKKPKKKLGFSEIRQIYENAKAPVKKLINSTRVGLSLVFVIGGEDAAKVAISYGIQSALVNGALAFLKEAVILEVKQISITADFMKEESYRFFKCSVRIRVITAIICLLQYVSASAKSKSKQ